jgi:hypothetical protein
MRDKAREPAVLMAQLEWHANIPELVKWGARRRIGRYSAIW